MMENVIMIFLAVWIICDAIELLVKEQERFKRIVKAKYETTSDYQIEKLMKELLTELEAVKS